MYAIEFVGRGGMIHYTYQFCRALAAQGMDVKLITARDYELADLSHDFAVEKIFRLWNPRPAGPVEWSNSLKSRWARRLVRAKNGLAYYREWWRVIRYVTRHRPDIVQFGDIRFPTDLIPIAVLCLSGVRLTDVCHNIAPFDYQSESLAVIKTSTIYRLLYRWIYGCFVAVFVHSETNRREFLRMYGGHPDKVHVIPHGNEDLFLETAGRSVDSGALRRRLDLLADAPVALFFGTVTKYKGLEYLIDAFAQVKQRLPAARLVIAGFPSWEVNIGRLYDRAKELKIFDSIIFHLQYIPNDEVGAFFSLSDLAVFPYRMIYQSGALQVAYSFGKPVVATTVGDLPEVVKHGETGLLVPPCDVGALAHALTTFLADPSLCRRMGRQARKFSETHHSWEQVGDRVRQVYDSLTQNR